MSFKVASVQIATLVIVVLVIAWAFIALTDDRLNLAVINETGLTVSKFAIRYENQYCSVNNLLPKGNIGCTLPGGGDKKISIYGRINDEAYVLESIGDIELGASVRNLVRLKPDKQFEITSKWVIE